MSGYNMLDINCQYVSTGGKEPKVMGSLTSLGTIWEA
jgi:hypothetical protein